MATKIVTKNSSTASAVPTASDLVQGELAVNVADKRLFTEDNGGAIVELGTNPSTLTVTGEITANGGIALGDNDEVTLGADDDFKIYHTATGNHSIIEETGGGNLVVRTNGSHIEFDKGSTEYMARMIPDGAVELYYDSALKLATTSTGIDVTGTATMDGLTVSSTTPVIDVLANTNEDASLRLRENGTGIVGAEFTYDGGDNALYLKVGNNTDTKRLSVSRDTGDISFYEDTGTTPKFFWDASAESLGIGTSPAKPLHVQDGSSGITAKAGTVAFIEGSGNTKVTVASGATSTGELLFGRSTDNDAGRIIYDHNNNSLSSYTAGAERMRIASNGWVNPNANVTGNPADSQGLHLGWNFSNGGGESLIVFNQGAGVTGGLVFSDNSANGTPVERMRIDASGNVGIGISNPSDYYTNFNSLVLGNTSTHSGMTIASGTSYDGTLAFADGTSGTAEYSGYIQYSHGTDSLSVGTSGSERMRIGSSGQVKIANGGSLNFDAAGSGNFDIAYKASDNTFNIINNSSSAAMGFHTSSTERMRIDSSGNLLVGTTNNDSSRMSVEAQSSGSAIKFRRNTATYGTSTVVGSITCDSSSTVYATSSDQRLKDNIADADDAGSKIDSIQVRKYDWKADGSHQDYGMIAQELQTVAPEAVSGDADSEEMMGVDYSKLVPMMLKEIQSLRNRVAQLEG